VGDSSSQIATLLSGAVETRQVKQLTTEELLLIMPFRIQCLQGGPSILMIEIIR